MRPAYLFLKSIKILAEKITKFTDNLTNMREDVVKVTKLSGVDNFYQVEVKNESHTLLNVLQSLMYNICFRERKSDKNPLEYIGYYQPHPLDEIMVLKLRFKNLDDVVINTAYVNDTLVELANEIRDKVNHYAKEWLAVTFSELKDIKEVIEFKSTL
jgi:DNA-directed RNA polymerase subunit L